jgi:membrane-bound lytic murein transglycosylase B
MRILGGVLLLLVACAVARADYSADPRAQAMYASLRADYGFSDRDIEWTRQALSTAKQVPQLIAAEQNAKERTLTWDAYEPIHVNAANIAAGLRFMRENRHWLARAEAEYGVPPQVVAAVLGVETKFGNYTGRHRTLDALATLGFDHPTRADFFRGELEEYFVLCRHNGFEPGAVRGSYAGALGAAQFMPSNYLKLGVDFDGDGHVDLWSAADAIGSVANYLAHFQPNATWQRGEPLYVAARASGALAADVPRNERSATLTVGALTQAGLELPQPLPAALPAGLVELKRDNGADYWLALPNFFRVMSYNPRVFYAASVAALANAMAHAQPVAGK